jgi:hypothetical protein
MEEAMDKATEAYVGFTLKMPGRTLGEGAATRYDEGNYHEVGSYQGDDVVSRVDLYLLDAAGTLVESKRFSGTEMVWTFEGDVQVIQPREPISTTPGDKYALVIINSPRPLITESPSDDYALSVSNEFPLSGFGGFTDFDDKGTMKRIFKGMLSGKSNLTTITAGVTADDVKAGQNHIAVSTKRLVSRVIVTKSPNLDANSAALGTFTDIQYSVAQGSKHIYLMPYVVNNEYLTPGYDYVADDNYIRTSADSYCYEDLHTPTDVLENPATGGMGFTAIEGKFLLENTHATYQKGNTAYVLVRAKFTPKKDAIADGGTLAADGTFYVGGTDGLIYSSMAAATDPTTGVANQKVATYTAGKVLYYAWINPDDVTNPVNAPVMRNNIYHININSFKTLGVNWNPLTPDINNPDPEPDGGNEPPSPIKPEDPLSSVDTYMAVDVTVENWTVHSHDIDF